MGTGKAGFTLTEVVVAAVILSTLAALLFPELAKAKSRAAEQHCVSNFRQIAVGLGQCLADHDGTDTPGPSDAMGFPMSRRDVFVDRSDPRAATLEVFICRGRPFKPDVPAGYTQMWAQPRWSEHFSLGHQAAWIRHAGRMQSAAFVLQDRSHQNEHPVNSWSVQRALGLRLDGSAKFRVRRGDSTHRTWWED